MKNPKTIVLFGRSGSGKGTQAKMLIDFLEREKGEKVLYLETGERFRNFIGENDSFTSRMTAEVLKHGGLMPPFMPVWLWTDFLVRHLTGEEDLILDGLCRRLPEAPILDSALSFYKRHKPIIMVIDVSKEWARERLKGRGRSDDTAEYIERRISWYDEDVVPAIEYFRHKPHYTIFDINGEQPADAVHAEVVRKMYEVFQPLDKKS